MTQGARQTHPAPRARADVVRRLAAASVMIPVSVAAAWTGGIAYALLLAIGGCLVTLEWVRLTAPRTTWRLGAIVPVMAVIAALAVFEQWGPAAALGVVLVGTVVAALAALPVGLPPGWVALGVIYAGLTVVALAALRADEPLGLIATLWLFALVWIADTAAFMFGRLIGGPRLAPAISPAKTWAGAVAAVASAAVVGLITAMVVADTSAISLAIVSGAIGIAGVGGDLFESGLKRRFGVKNTGDLIPGHGGMMDRVDSLIVAALIAAAVGVIHGGSDAPARGALIW